MNSDQGAWRVARLLLRPPKLRIDRRERWRVVIGVGVGLLFASAMSLVFGAASPSLVAPIGASAVIAFALPSSPLAQPWAVVGGNTISAFVGIPVANLVHGAQWGGAAPVLRALWAR